MGAFGIKIRLFFLMITFLSSYGLTQEAIVAFPKNNHISKDSIINFQAKTVLQASNYRFQVSQTITFDNIVFDTLVSSPNVSLNLGSSNQVYFWRLKSILNNDSTNWSLIYKLTIFSPKNASNTVLWYSSSSVNQLDNTPINLLTDLSALGNNATQLTAALQPTYKTTGGFRNLPYINFTGSDGMQTPINNSIIRNDSTLTFVSLQLNRNQGYGALFYLGNSGSFTPLYAGRTAGSSYNNGAFRFLGYNGTVFTFDLQTPNNSYKIISGQNSLSQAKLFANGIQVGVAGSSIVQVASGATLKIGSNQDYAENYNGALHELVIFRNSIDTATIRNTERLIDAIYCPKPNLGDNITRYNGFCDSNVVLSPGVGFASYLWSNGSTNPTLTVNQFGTYSVRTTDSFGYAFTDIIEYRPNVVFNYPSLTNICAGSSITWNTGITAYNIVWSDGVTGSSRNITVPGSYFYDVVDLNLCSVRSDTITFTIDNYTNTAFLGADTSLCAGNFLGLQVGAPETTDYLWGDGTSNSSLLVNTTGTYSVLTTNVNGCLAQDTINVNIIGVAPLAQFVTGNQCDQTAVACADQSVPVGASPIDAWQWDFGDGQGFSSSQNPNYTYSTPGTYTIQLYVSQGGCGAYHYDTIQVFENPVVDFDYAGHCQGATIQFSNLSTAGGAPIQSYAWDFDMPETGAYNTSTIPVPNRIFENAGEYFVSFMITDGNGCKDSIVQSVIIDPTPQTLIDVINSCQFSAADIVNLTPTEPGLIYNWSFGDNSFSILPNPVKTYDLYGTYIVSLNVTNTFGCVGTQAQDIEVYPKPTALMDLGPACVGSFGTLGDVSIVISGSIDSTMWIINATDTLYGANASYPWSSLGQQQVVLTTFSAVGCSASTNQFFDITETLTASFTPASPIVAAGDPIAFSNTSQGNGIYLWNFGDNSFSSQTAPSHIYGDNYIDSTLTISLIALNISGCIDTAVQYIQVLEPSLDLELSQLFVDEVDGWNIIGVKMKNTGTADITKATLVLRSQKGFLFNEVWEGVLNPLEDSIYVFSAEPIAGFSNQDQQDAFYCVDGVGYSISGEQEEDLTNNTVCKDIEGQRVILLPVYPNPIEDVLHISLLVSVTSEVSIDLIDTRGRLVKSVLPSQSLLPGVFSYDVPVSQINAGAYFLRMTTADGEVVEKVTVK